MLAMRDVGPEGFGKKNRGWNSTELLKDWREAWSAHVNERMAELGLEGRIDHRSYEAQGIALEPQHKIGPAASRRPEQGLEAERIEDHARIARDNGEKIIANPSIALDAITRQQATFTTRDLAVFAFRHSDGKEQFDQVMTAVRASPELVALGKDGRDQERFTSRDMIAVEARLERSAGALAARDGHGIADRQRDAAIGAAQGRGLVLSAEQRDALDHITGRKGLASVVGYAGSGKSAMLGVAREAWERQGYQVRGAALSGIAAENLEGGSGIQSRTLASLEHAWGQGREQLGPRDVLVVDEAGMIGSRQMERVLSQARDAGAKVVMIGDPEQLQAIEAGAAFRSVTERHGAAEITEIRRQREDWQRDATRALATGRTGEAIHAYDGKGMVHAADTREQARGELVDGWDRQRQAEPGKSRIILTHTNAEVRELNEEARGRLRATGDLGDDVTFSADRGTRAFARGDRLMFLRNERSLGVKNGTLGTIEQVSAEGMKVRLDSGARVAFDAKDYAAVDHGYAATFHKAQGVTVDHAHVLATPGMDRHSAYVGMSRHRDDVQLHYGRDDFADQRQLVRAMSRDRGKDMAGDYARPEQDQARAFADRREIRFPELARQVAEKVRDKARGMFAGFRPKPTSEKTTSPERIAADRPLAPSQARAIERYGRAAADIGRMREKGLPVLAHQEQALAKAGDALDQVRPNGARDLASAIERDPQLARAAAEGNTGGAAKAMEVERQVRIDPEKRAGRFVEQWQDMKAARASMERAGDRAGAEKLGKRMESIAGGLHRDPQLESALKRHAPELALNMERGRSIGQELAQSVGQGRDRDRGMSR
ncbi:MAG: Ti-type conjugative transfer relaxase TraA [Sphingomonas pseudosanguinis]|jgi:Ti-type conjugative transfer relaxase TraA|uniref:Conjugal transfer protein TraA n=2 Tax=Sphingomonadaceae TaxID=41297 RepID=A0A1E1F7C7_9SPHN|nr:MULTISPECIES: Ti-type conjugative transfer relaxase TraA [Sphingomonadaceae]KKI21455.1 conjugal transfer protein TraA [Sphingomonas sp. Ag1]NNG59455.1 Ti-type conjugative transfer relaxase TraA [Sphingomonas paucimobilis]BAV66420.1 conjugal transfer protein TraA [Sphingobium cloacae]